MNHCFDLTHFHGGKSRFNPNDGLVCSFWGPTLWFSLHAMAANFPVELDLQKKKDLQTSRRYRSFLLAMRHILPCKKCRENYAQHLKVGRKTVNKPTMLFDNRRDFEDFVFLIHNLVNKQTNKPVLNKKELEKMRKLYRSGRIHPQRKPGRSFVVVQPVKSGKSMQNTWLDSIIFHQDCVL